MNKKQPTSSTSPTLIVGVGASAGGLEAFQELLKHLGASNDLAVVIIQHLDPTSKALLAELLSAATPMPLVDVVGRIKLQPGHVYLAPAQQYLNIKNGAIQSVVPETGQSPLAAIDHFFHCLAEDQGDRAIGVILSGAGSDGTVGLKAISDAGGLTFAQDAASAKFDSMPRSAATTGVADHVCRPREIAAELLRYAEHINEFGDGKVIEKTQKQIGEAIPRITELMLAVTGHNFQHYKITTLMRRIQRRMQILKIATASEYLQRLQGDEEETTALFRELLIGVTAFFRDPDAFDAISSTVLPSIFENKGSDDIVRIWVAGCSTGQEAYSLAIACHELTRTLANPPDFQIFATDIDERALQAARTGTYPSGIEEQVSPERLKTYFVKRGKHFQVTKEIRERVLFSKHNLISDPPFSRQDLISCRNLLIYLGAHLQEKLIPLFHYALRPSGFLFLGPSETISSHGELFRALDAKFRISQRKGTATGTFSTMTMRAGTVKPVRSIPNLPDQVVDLNSIRQRILLDEFAPKAVVIDQSGQVLNSSDGIDKYLSISGGDFQNNIIKMVMSGLRIGLRAAINEAKKTRRKVTHDNLSIRDHDCIQRVMLTVQPMPQLGEQDELLLVVFHDVGKPLRREEDDTVPDSLATGNQDADAIIAQMERELETTRSDLERTMQDMEAANEELKSSNEELLSMNEELQSANEELETSKEEIRSSSDAVARSNSDLENLLRSTRIATIFLDDDLTIRSFTPAATEIYGLIPTDVGRPLAHIVPSVHDMPPLPDPRSLELDDLIEATVVAHSGKSFIRRVLPYQSYSGAAKGLVVTFNDVTQLKESQELFQLLVDASSQIVWITNDAGFVTEDSPSWRAFTGQTYDEWVGHGWLQAIHPSDREPTLSEWERVLNSGSTFSVEYRLRHRSGGYRWTQVRAVAQRNPDGEIRRWIGMNSDIDDRKRAEERLAIAKDRLELSMEVSDVAPWNWDLQNNELVSNPTLNRLFGFSENETPKLAEFVERIDESVRDRVSRAIENSMHTGEPYDEEYSVQFPSGETRHLRARGKARLSNDGVMQDFFGVVIDITQRKERELDLAQREAHLRRVINNQLGLVGVIDRDGILLEVDDHSLEIAHTRRDEVIGKHFADAPWWTYDPDVADGMRIAMDRAFAGEIVRYDVSLFSHGDDGVLVDFMIAPVENQFGEIEYLIPSGVDIRERAAYERSLKETSRRMEMAMRAGGMAAWEWTPKKSFWTEQLYELIGVDPKQEASSELFFSLVHPDDIDQLKSQWQTAVDGTDAYDAEFRIIRPDGQTRWINGMGEVVRDKTGTVVKMYGVNWDSTREHEQASALRESEQRAQAANASKSAFLANMSHEIRTPMTAILGYADLLKDFVQTEEAQQHLQTIRRNGDYLLGIINDILDLSKIEAGKFEVEHERFDPTRVIEDVQSIMDVRAQENGLSLAVEYHGKLPKVIESDAIRLKQILINLVGNAIKFTRAGRIEIRVWYEASRQHLHFDVIDTGIGMTQTQIDRLFKPFSQGDSSVSRHFGGTGLGLAISKRLAEMLGGGITASSTAGVGSTFSVTITTGDITDQPLVDHPSGESANNVLPSEAEVKPSTETLDCHVLIVDDRRDIRFLSKRILTKAGATIEECEDGRVAVEHMVQAIKTNQCPDLILLDMQMPNLDGYQTARKLRELGYTGPIIALTADAMQGDMNECLEAGCNDYLSKPIDSQRMLQLIAGMTR
jgi:two-component system CheB/CheR fusion protein